MKAKTKLKRPKRMMSDYYICTKEEIKTSVLLWFDTD